MVRNNLTEKMFRLFGESVGRIVMTAMPRRAIMLRFLDANESKNINFILYRGFANSIRADEAIKTHTNLARLPQGEDFNRVHMSPK